MLTGPAGSLAGLALWLEASHIQLADGAGVSDWSDESGQANDATQSTASAVPVFHRAGLGGLPDVSFSSARGSFLELATPILQPSYTLFAVARQRGGNQLIALGGFDEFFGPSSSSGPGSVLLRGSRDVGVTAPSNAVAGAHVYSAVVSGAVSDTRQGTANVYVDGQSVGTSSMPWGTFRAVGERTAYDVQLSDGDISEVIVYSRALSDSERASIETYLDDKYFGGTPPCTAGAPISDTLVLTGTQTTSTSTEPVTFTISATNLGKCLSTNVGCSEVSNLHVERNGTVLIDKGCEIDTGCRPYPNAGGVATLVVGAHPAQQADGKAYPPQFNLSFYVANAYGAPWLTLDVESNPPGDLIGTFTDDSDDVDEAKLDLAVPNGVCGL